MRIMGIDPGKRGAFVTIDTETMQAQGELMPYLGRELDIKGTAQIIRDHDPLLVILERQIGMAGQGRTSIFSIAKAYGELRACVEVLGKSYLTPLPSQWTKEAFKGVPGKGKERSIGACTRLFPGLDLTPGRIRKPHDGIADAAMLAWYGAQHPWAKRANA